MKPNEIVAPKRKKIHRVGRGISAGQGKTAGRGTKGQKSRTGYNLPRRFEGGQMPLIARLPKRRGFKPMFAKPTTVRIDAIVKKVKTIRLNPKVLFEAGLINAKELKMGKIKIVGGSKELNAYKWNGQKIKFSEPLKKQILDLRKS